MGLPTLGPVPTTLILPIRIHAANRHCGGPTTCQALYQQLWEREKAEEAPPSEDLIVAEEKQAGTEIIQETNAEGGRGEVTGSDFPLLRKDTGRSLGFYIH